MSEIEKHDSICPHKRYLFQPSGARGDESCDEHQAKITPVTKT